MRRKILPVLLFLTVVLAGCGQKDSNESSSLKANEVENIRELVKDYSLRNIKDESASITSQQLIVEKSGGKELVYDLSDEDFFVSIAPFINQTHP
jgi:hypothetical protein